MNNEAGSNPKNKIRILLISSYQIIQESLKILIEDNRDMAVTNCLDFGSNLPDALDLSRIDSVLIYLKDEDCESVEIIAELLKAGPHLRIVVVAGNEDYESQMRALQLGAVGIVKKEQNTKLLIEAIRQTFRGDTWINQVLLSKLLRNNYQKTEKADDWDRLQIEPLTKREKQVIELICKGLKNKEIANLLFISEATVRHHLSSVYGKLGVEDRLNLVIYAYQNNLIETSDEESGKR